MRKFFAGLVVGLVIATASLSLADNPIRLVVDGKEISFPEAPPVIINGRTMVPARPLAEALGAKVGWDEQRRAVIVETIPSKVAEPETDWTSMRELGAANRWVLGETSDPHTIYAVANGKRLEIIIGAGPDLTGTTDSGATVRARIVDGRLLLNVPDLVQAGFISR